MLVEYVGLEQTRAYVYEAKGKGTNGKTLVKTIEEETGFSCKMEEDNLIVGNTIVPLDFAVLIENGYVQTLPKEDLKAQYREIVDAPQEKLDEVLGMVEQVKSNTKRLNELTAPVTAPEATVDKTDDVSDNSQTQT